MENYDLIVVGAGPGGIATVIESHALQPDARILLVEAGRSHARRHCPVDKGQHCNGCGNICNVISGFGGSMHYGDGIKLSLLPSGRRLVDLFGEFRASELCADAFALIAGAIKVPLEFAGADVSPSVLGNFLEAGLEIRQYPVAVVAESSLEEVIDGLFDRAEKACEIAIETRARRIVRTADGFKLTLSDRTSSWEVLAPYVVLATGRRGFDEGSSILEDLKITTRPPSPSVGVRFEMPAKFLGPIGMEHPDLKITQRVGGTNQKVKTFCFCGGANGGRIKFTRYFSGFGMDIITIDGHETVERVAGDRPLAGNFGLLCQLTEDRTVADFVENYSRELGGRPGAQSYNDFFGRTIATTSSWHALNSALPYEPSLKDLHLSRLDVLFTEDELNATRIGFERVMEPILDAQGITLSSISSQILVVGPEIEFFWDEVEISESCETSEPDLFVVGDKAGVAQGAVQAAMTGIAAARAIASRSGSGR